MTYALICTSHLTNFTMHARYTLIPLTMTTPLKHALILMNLARIFVHVRMLNGAPLNLNDAALAMYLNSTTSESWVTGVVSQGSHAFVCGVVAVD